MSGCGLVGWCGWQCLFSTTHPHPHPHPHPHALKYPNTHSSTPPSALFREYRKAELNRTTYDGGHFIEHLLIGGELHLSEDLSKTFIVTSGGENREIDDQVIDYVLEHQSVYLLHVISETAVGENLLLWTRSGSR